MGKADTKSALRSTKRKRNAERRWANSKGSGFETKMTQSVYAWSPNAIVKA